MEKLHDRIGVPPDHIKIYRRRWRDNQYVEILPDEIVGTYSQYFGGVAFFREGEEEWGWFDDPRENGGEEEEDPDALGANLIALTNWVKRHKTQQKIRAFYSNLTFE